MASAPSDQKLQALLELERRNALTPDLSGQLKMYRAQGIAKPLKVQPGSSDAASSELGQASNVFSAVNQALDQTGYTTAGALGSIIGEIPGTTGRDLRGAIDTLRANLAFDKLSEMRKNSPTGGAVGNVSDADIRLLASTVASLDTKQSPGQLKENIERVGAHYSRMLKSLGYTDDQLAQANGGKAPDFGDGAVAVKPPAATPPSGSPPPPDKVVGIGEGIHNAIDDAVGVNGPAPVKVGIDDASAKQTPEFRAGLAKLLADPKVTGDEIRAYWDKNAPGWAASEKDATPPPPAPLAVRRGDGGVVEGVDAAIRGAADVASFGMADELAAAGRTIFGDGTMAENLRRERAVDRYDEESSPWLRGAGQLAGAIAVPFGAGARGALETAKVGGTLGALYGAGSGETLGDRFTGAIGGGVAGAAGGAVLGKLSDLYVNRAAARAARRGAPREPIRDVADRLNIQPTPATTGGAFSEGMQAGFGNLPGSLGPIRNAVDAETAGITDAAKRAATAMGPVRTPAEAGQVIARGARVADRKAAREAGAVYDRRTGLMGGDASPVLVGGTARAIENISRDFPSNPVLGELLQHPLVGKLRGVANGADAELSLDEATRLLSEVRRVKNKAVSGPSGSQPLEFRRNLTQIEQALEDDVMNAARASDAIAGRGASEGAAAAQTEGDKLWAKRMAAQGRELKTSLASIADDVKVPAERVYGQLFNAMNENGGNIALLRKSMEKLPKKARDTFAASAFDDLGRATDSAQNAAADAWSFDTFMTNWAKKSDEAKRLVFGGRGVDREISDIVRYAERLKELGRSRNFSNTGRQVANSGFVGALATTFTSTAAATGSLSGAAGATTAVASAYPVLNATAKAFLQVPAMRQWLRSAMRASVRGNESQARVLVRRLPALAVKHPALRGEIEGLEATLLRALNDNAPRRAAASGDGQKQNEQ